MLHQKTPIAYGLHPVFTEVIVQEINIKIESYGAVEKHLPADLSIACQANSLVLDVLNQIKTHYPAASNLLDRCACAMGEDIIPRQTPLSQDSTLVLLSPVAGG